MASRIVSVAVLALTLAVGGCGVKKETHQKVLDELTATQSELGKTKKERDDLAARLKAVEDELSGMQTDSEKAAREAREMIRKLGGNAQKLQEELEKLQKQQADAEKRLAAYRKLQEKLRKLIDTGKLSIAFRNGQMVLQLPSGILFASGKGKLSTGGKAALQEVLNILLEFKDRRFMIAGHTDNVPIKTRKFKNNWQLSTARAVSVVEFMVQSGFEGKNISAAGFGEFDPVAANDTNENRQLNRRIEIILVPDLSELPNLTTGS